MMKEQNNQHSYQSNQAVLDKYLAGSATLKSLIEKENEYLRASKLSDIQNFADEKERLIEEVEEYKKYLVADREYLKTLPHNVKEQIIRVSDGLKKAAEKNNYETRVAMEVNKLILEAVHNSVMAHQKEAEIYNDSGVTSAYNSSVKYTRPIKFNEAV